MNVKLRLTADKKFYVNGDDNDDEYIKLIEKISNPDKLFRYKNIKH